MEFLVLTGGNAGSRWKLQWDALKGSQMTHFLWGAQLRHDAAGLGLSTGVSQPSSTITAPRTRAFSPLWFFTAGI